jgi:ribosomal-protein-alanine N-acetyltransferase
MRILSLRMQLRKMVLLELRSGETTTPWSPSVEYSVLSSIRDFHKEDFETLWRIDQQCFSPGVSYSRPELAAYIRMASAFTLVAVTPVQTAGEIAAVEQPGIREASDIVGFIVASVNTRRAGHIITIDVAAEARRSGIGSALLESAEERLKMAGCVSVRLETAVNNTPALVFYKRHGYSVSRTMARYYPDGVDAFVMRKDLLSKPVDR